MNQQLLHGYILEVDCVQQDVKVSFFIFLDVVITTRTRESVSNVKSNFYLA